MASFLLSHGIDKLNAYVNFVEDVGCILSNLKAVSDEKLYHARFGHLNFAILLRLQKFDMVSSLPTLQAPVKHVCDGCTLDKMWCSSFPKDGSV